MLTLLALAVLLLAGPLAPDEGRAAFVIAVVAATAVEATATGYEAASLGAERPRRVAVGQTLAAVVLMGMLLVMYLGSGGVVLAVVGLAAAASVRLAWNAFRWFGELRGPRPLLEPGTWLRQALPFLLIAMLGAVYYRLDIVILHSLRGPDAAASYAAAYRLLDAGIVLGGVVANLLIPRLSRAWTGAPDAVWSLWRRYALVTGALALPAVVVVFVGAYPIAELLFGVAYRQDAGAILRILSPSIAFAVLQGVNAAVVFASDRQGALVALSLVHVCLNVVLTVLLVSSDGARGAAVATSISAAFTFVYFALIVRRWTR